MSRIISIGEAMVELSASDQPDLWRLGVAGDTLNTAWYLRRLMPRDWQIDYLTRVGTGEFSQKLLDFLTAEGIGTDHIARDPEREIGLYAISLKDGERSFSYWRDSSAARRLADDPGALARALRGARMAYLSGITLAILPEEGRASLMQALTEARDAGTIVVFDPNLRPRLWEDATTMTDTVMAAARLSDTVLPSHDDEATWFGDADPAATAQRYAAAGAGCVIVKNGAGPMVACEDGQHSAHEPVPARAIVDTTAAGDSFNAAYLAARLQGAPLAAAVRAGATLAARVIGARGALIRQD